MNATMTQITTCTMKIRYRNSLSAVTNR